MRCSTTSRFGRDRIGPLLCLTAVAILLAGCGGGEPDHGMTGNPDVDAINERVTDVPRMPELTDRFPDFFPEGSVPDEEFQARLLTFSAKPKGTPTITGQTATVEVELTKFGDRSHVVGDVTWTLEKQGGKWVFTDLPLPSP